MDNSKLAKRLKTLRESLRMTQRELASEFKVAPGTIALWELGKRQVPGPVVRLIELYEQAVRDGYQLSKATE